MFGCPRRYASKSCLNLKQLSTPTSAPEPLWFLYPKWFRQDCSLHYHTGHAPGQDRHHLFHGAPLSSRRHQSTKPSPNEPRKKTARKSERSSEELEESVAKVQRAVLSKRGVFQKTVTSACRVRKTVTSAPRVRRLDHIPEERRLRDTTRYLRKINPHTLFNLLRSSPSSKPESTIKATRINLSEAAQNELMDDVGKVNTWRHYDGSTCFVTFAKGCLELRGTDRAQELARSHFSDPGCFTRSPEHISWYRQARNHTGLSVDNLPLPPVWTVRSLIDYVRLLTRPYSGRSAHRKIYDGAGSHHLAVFKILRRLFADPTTSPFLSTRVLHLALSYCRRHTEFPTTAVDLWDAFLETGLHPDVSCFNQELGRCLIDKRLNRFCKLVLEMHYLGVLPDSATWALVTTYAEHNSRLKPVDVVQMAIGRSTTPSNAHTSLIMATAKREFAKYIGTKNGVKRFIKWFDQHFGPDWLTSRILQQLFRACRVDRVKVGLASELILSIREVGKLGLIDKGCLVELIRICKNAKDLPAALRLVKDERLSHAGDIPQEVIDIIFSMAWREKRFNLCRCFWFLAATTGRITFEMQRLVRQSLTANVTDLEDRIQANWQLLAGKVIVGTNLNADGFEHLFPTIWKKEEQSTPVQWLLEWTSDDKSRVEQVQLAQLLMERDLNAFRFYERMSRDCLLRLVDEAANRDKQWQATNAIVTLLPQDMIDESLSIQLKRRQGIISIPREHESEDGQRRWFCLGGHKLDYDKLEHPPIRRVTCLPLGKSPPTVVGGRSSRETHDSAPARGVECLRERDRPSLDADVEEEQVVWQASV